MYTSRFNKRTLTHTHTKFARDHRDISKFIAYIIHTTLHTHIIHIVYARDINVTVPACTNTSHAYTAERCFPRTQRHKIFTNVHARTSALYALGAPRGGHWRLVRHGAADLCGARANVYTLNIRRLYVNEYVCALHTWANTL